MKQTTIQVKTEQEKINAIRICMAGKDGGLEQELTEYVDALYKKYVPAAVREVIEKSDAQEQTAHRVTRRKPVSGDHRKDGTDTAEVD